MKISRVEIGKRMVVCKIYDADDEFPDCNECYFMDDCDGGVKYKDTAFAIKCGAEGGWKGYKRIEPIESIH